MAIRYSVFIQNRRGVKRLIAWLVPTLFVVCLWGCSVAFIGIINEAYNHQGRLNNGMASQSRANAIWMILENTDIDVSAFGRKNDVRVIVLNKNGSMRCSHKMDCIDISNLLHQSKTGSSAPSHLSQTIVQHLHTSVSSIPHSTRAKMASILLAISERAQWVFTGEHESPNALLNLLEQIKARERKTGMIYSRPGFYHPVPHHYKHRPVDRFTRKGRDRKRNADEGNDGNDDDDEKEEEVVDDNIVLPEITTERYDLGAVSERGLFVFHSPCLTQKYCLQSNPPIYLAKGTWTSLWGHPAPTSVLAHRDNLWFLIGSILSHHNGNNHNIRKIKHNHQNIHNHNNKNNINHQNDNHDLQNSNQETRLLIGLILQRLFWETNHMLTLLPYSEDRQFHPKNTTDKTPCENENRDIIACKNRSVINSDTRAAKSRTTIKQHACLKTSHSLFHDINGIINNHTFMKRQNEIFNVMKYVCATKNISLSTCAQNFVSAYTKSNIAQAATDSDLKQLMHDLNILSQWFKILSLVDYKFPHRRPYKENVGTPINSHQLPMWFAPSPCKPIQRFKRRVTDRNNSPKQREENGTAVGRWTNLINKNMCQGTEPFHHDKMHQNFVPQQFNIPDILLIIVFNYPYLASHVPLLLAMYGRHFRHILFCGEHFSSFAKFYKMEKGIGVSFVEINHYEGTWGYSCMSAAIKMNYDVTGYLQMSDDVLLNVWNLEGIPRDRCWFQSRVRVADTRLARVPDIATTNRWYPWIFAVGQPAANSSLVMLKKMDKSRRLQPLIRPFLDQLTETTRCRFCLLYEASDIFYLPKRLGTRWAVFADIFQSNGVHLEIAVPSAIFGVTPEAKVFRLRGNYIWGDDRSDFQKYYSVSDHFQHAFKLSRLAVAEDAAFFCQNYLSWIERDLVRSKNK